MENQLLPDKAKDRLTRTCRTAVGDSLRSLTYINRFDYEQVYLREDLERDADLNSFIGNEWHDFKMTQDAYRGSELGDYRYTIRVFENGYLVRITIEDSGVFITTDGITMQDFEALSQAVEGVLDEWAVAE
ncbi:hypothetical protein SAMN04487949_2466 [Halogranum gelatinilyticum]|uniref:Uncharacterized protein n=1 Tax=Halogranum gelatinilyticum TaxID=660521 RepID=A0A1G9VRA1_9EURY|nr:hypothetical protein [Halogranum gelatinilyticum]SDM74375.1 hypothetical protein SAMN04487949_2466 [Halogranum gelatinilyticum]